MANIDLFQNNTKLVYSMVSKFNIHPNDRDDIIQCGMLGLFKASQKFDSRRGKFSTYACYSILNAIKTELKKSSKQYKNLILTDFSIEPEAKPPTTEENIEFLSVNEQQIYNMINDGMTRKEIAKKFNCSLKTIRQKIDMIKEKCKDELEC